MNSLGARSLSDRRQVCHSWAVPADSKNVSNASALFSCTADAPIPFQNPGLISIPLGFLLAYIGAVTSKERDDKKYAELEVRSLTGVGAH